jgi:hypothetical protein
MAERGPGQAGQERTRRGIEEEVVTRRHDLDA